MTHIPNSGYIRKLNRCQLTHLRQGCSLIIYNSETFKTSTKWLLPPSIKLALWCRWDDCYVSSILNFSNACAVSMTVCANCTWHNGDSSFSVTNNVEFGVFTSREFVATIDLTNTAWESCITGFACRVVALVFDIFTW